MKYTFIFCLFLVVSVRISSAQIIFTSDELIASFGRQSSQTNFIPAGLDGLQSLIDLSGASQTWDFTGIQWMKDTTAITSTSTFLQYPGGAAMAEDSDFTHSTHVMKGVSSVPGDPITYDFFKIDQNGFWILGESQDNSGVKLKTFSFTPPFQELKFPLTYRDSWRVTSNIYSSQLPPGTPFTEKIEAVVDGYGTLLLPGTTSDCLRLKYRLTVATNFLGLNYESTQYTFLWITSNGVSAVIDADSSGKVSSTSSPQSPAGQQPTSYHAQGTSSVGTNFLSSDGLYDIKLSQNPSRSETKLFFTMKSSGSVLVSLMDALGREVHILRSGHAEAGQNIIPIDPRTLSAGTYFIRINAGGITAMRKLIITK